jgi:hypothetical protein
VVALKKSGLGPDSGLPSDEHEPLVGKPGDGRLRRAGLDLRSIYARPHAPLTYTMDEVVSAEAGIYVDTRSTIRPFGGRSGTSDCSARSPHAVPNPCPYVSDRFGLNR